MPRNGSGTYSLPKPPFVPNTTISSSDVNSDFSDIATALTASVAADGQTSITGQLKFPSGTSALPSHTFGSELTTGMYLAGAGQIGFTGAASPLVIMDSTVIGAGKDGSILRYANGAVLVPVGKVDDFAGSAAPAGWFLCYGQAISRTGYPELFDVIGTTFGSGDGSTTFNVPDLRGRGTWGRDDMGGTAANRITAAGSGVTGTTLGAAGGGQSITIAQGNLPNCNFNVSGIGITDNRTWGTQNNTLILTTGLAGSLNVGSTVAIGSATVSVQSGSISINNVAGVQGVAASGGSGTPIPALEPGIILNKIIFAGRV